MNCYKHPETTATGFCTVCGRAVCDQCGINTEGKLTCIDCISAGRTVSQPVVPGKKTNVLAIISLISSILGLCTFLLIGGCASIFQITGFITGLIAKNQITNEPDQDGMTLAKVGMWMGLISFVLTIIFIIVVFVFYGSAAILQNMNGTNFNSY